MKAMRLVLLLPAATFLRFEREIMSLEYVLAHSLDTIQ